MYWLFIVFLFIYIYIPFVIEMTIKKHRNRRYQRRGEGKAYGELHGHVQLHVFPSHRKECIHGQQHLHPRIRSPWWNQQNKYLQEWLPKWNRFKCEIEKKEKVRELKQKNRKVATKKKNISFIFDIRKACKQHNTDQGVPIIQQHTNFSSESRWTNDIIWRNLGNKSKNNEREAQ